MIDPGKRDLRLLGAEGRHREQLHSEEQRKSHETGKSKEDYLVRFLVVETGSTSIPPLAASLPLILISLLSVCQDRDLTYLSLPLKQRHQRSVIFAIFDP